MKPTVHALMATQLEREYVALPKLVGLRAFEPARRLVTRLALFMVDEQALLVQDAAHRRFGDAEPGEPREHVADAPRAPLGVLAAHRDHLVARNG
jgi:hypothetical protein